MLRSKNKLVTLIAGSGRRKEPPRPTPAYSRRSFKMPHPKRLNSKYLSLRSKAEAAQSEAGCRLPGAPGRRGRPHFHGQLGSILRQEHLLRGDSGGHPGPAQAGERAAETYPDTILHQDERCGAVTIQASPLSDLFQNSHQGNCGY